MYEKLLVLLLECIYRLLKKYKRVKGEKAWKKNLR